MLESLRNLIRLEKKKDINNKSLGDIRNLFRLGKDKDIKERVLRDIRTPHKPDKENYYKPIRTGNAFSSNYIEYESNGDKDKTLSIKEYLDGIKPYLNGLIDDLKTKGECKIQLTIAISSKDSDETRIMHTKSDNIEIMTGNEKMKSLKNLLNLFYKNIIYRFNML